VPHGAELYAKLFSLQNTRKNLKQPQSGRILTD